ncbi:hypothetical protein ACJZ2D_002948 [Fusarium nematophilum]
MHNMPRLFQLRHTMMTDIESHHKRSVSMNRAELIKQAPELANESRSLGLLTWPPCSSRLKRWSFCKTVDPDATILPPSGELAAGYYGDWRETGRTGRTIDAVWVQGSGSQSMDIEPGQIGLVGRDMDTVRNHSGMLRRRSRYNVAWRRIRMRLASRSPTCSVAWAGWVSVRLTLTQRPYAFAAFIVIYWRNPRGRQKPTRIRESLSKIAGDDHYSFSLCD